MDGAPKITMRIDGLDQLAADMRKAGSQFLNLLTQAMDNSTTLIQNRGRENITAGGTSYTGNLRRSIQKKPSTPTRGLVTVGEKYGAAVEFGRKPGAMPPVEPLERWAKVKLGQSGLGFVIARKIGRSGTKAQPYMLPAFEQSIPDVVGYFDKAATAFVKGLGR